MRFLFSILFISLSSSTFAQDLQYPQWVASHYCQNNNSENCIADLSVDALYGVASEQREKSDADEPEQWGMVRTEPRLALCTYNNPKNPEWGFIQDCYFTSHQRVSAFLFEWWDIHTVEGNNFILETVKEHGVRDKHTANGAESVILDRFGALCHRLIATDEELCVYPISQPEVREERGVCLWGSTSNLETSDCSYLNICPHDPLGMESGCSHKFQWQNGRVTQIDIAEDWIEFLDGKAVNTSHPQHNWWDNSKPRCLHLQDTNERFCFDTTGVLNKPHQELASLQAALIDELKPLELVSEELLNQVVKVMFETLNHHTIRSQVAAIGVMLRNPDRTARFVAGSVADELSKPSTISGTATVALVGALTNAMADFAYETTLADGTPTQATIAKQIIRYVGSAVKASFAAASSNGNVQMFVGVLITDQAEFIARDFEEFREVQTDLENILSSQAMSSAFFDLRIASEIRNGENELFEKTRPELFESFARSQLVQAFEDFGEEVFVSAHAAETARRWAANGQVEEALTLIATTQGFMHLLDERAQSAALDFLGLAARSIRQNE